MELTESAAYSEERGFEMSKLRAESPQTSDGREYHLRTKAGDLSPLCLLVGSPERAGMIATEFFTEPQLVGDHRGTKSYSGYYGDERVSVVATGMGSPSMGIVLPEAHRSGARVFIRVGSCSTLLPEPKPGDVIIVTAAMRLEGASRNWAQIEYPAFADHRVVYHLMNGCEPEDGDRCFFGVEATTDDFVEGQGRPNMDGFLSVQAVERHEELIRLGVACYSMEASALFVWCATHGGGIPAGAINAVYGNRVTNAFETTGDELAARLALNALVEMTDYKQWTRNGPLRTRW